MQFSQLNECQCQWIKWSNRYKRPSSHSTLSGHRSAPTQGGHWMPACDRRWCGVPPAPPARELGLLANVQALRLDLPKCNLVDLPVRHVVSAHSGIVANVLCKQFQDDVALNACCRAVRFTWRRFGVHWSGITNKMFAVKVIILTDRVCSWTMIHWIIIALVTRELRIVSSHAAAAKQAERWVRGPASRSTFPNLPCPQGPRVAFHAASVPFVIAASLGVAFITRATTWKGPVNWQHESTMLRLLLLFGTL